MGELELITWGGVDNGIRLGWGGIVVEESAALKRRFETDMGRDEAQLFSRWPAAFRWRCCGMDGESRMGCDHHGNGSPPPPRPCG